MALVYHAREHGDAAGQEYVVVQGRAEPDMHPAAELRARLEQAGVRLQGPLKRGPFWGRWLREYYDTRIAVHVHVERVVVRPDLRCAGEPDVYGRPLPAAGPDSQAVPAKGTGPRVDAERAGRRLRRLPHVLLAYMQADGYPTAVPVEVRGASERGLELGAADGVLPPGGRRAGLLGHSYRAQLIGIESRQSTGWLEVSDGIARYAPHTQHGFVAPPNKTLLLLANGLLAKLGVRKARREGRLAGPEGRSSDRLAPPSPR